MNKTERDSSIDTYRLLLTFGICWLHCITQCGINDATNGRIGYYLGACVDGFVLISGWFGINSTWKKGLKLIGLAFWATCIIMGIYYALFGALPGVNPYQIVKGNWFIWAYIFLMLVAPLANIAVKNLLSEDKSTRRLSRVAIASVLGCVFAWGFLADTPYICKFIPKTDGIHSYSGLTLLGCYLVGRLMRIYSDRRVLTKKWFVALGLISVVGVGSHMSSYNSPFVVVLAALAFLAIRKTPVSLGRLSVALAPSCLIVFVAHTNEAGFTIIRRAVCLLVTHHVPLIVSSVVTAGGLFIGILLIDQVRRILQNALIKRKSSYE